VPAAPVAVALVRAAPEDAVVVERAEG
jgi:hypothetical protein